MNGNPVLRAKNAGRPLIWGVVFGSLAAAATVVQMVLLGEVVARVLLEGSGLEEVRRPLGLLLGAVVARPGFVWLREVSVLRGAERAKRRVREQLLTHLLALGPAYHDGATYRRAYDDGRGGRREAGGLLRPLPAAGIPECAGSGPDRRLRAVAGPLERARAARHRAGNTGAYGPDRAPRREAHALAMDRPLPNGRPLPGCAARPYHAQRHSDAPEPAGRRSPAPATHSDAERWKSCA